MKATWDDIKRELAKGPATAQEVGETLRPDLAVITTSRGGPSRAAYWASMQLGRMRRRGLVQHYAEDAFGQHGSQWLWSLRHRRKT